MSLSDKLTIHSFPLTRFGIPTDSANYSVKKLFVTSEDGNPGNGAFRISEVQSSSGTFAVGALQPEVFSIDLESQPKKGTNPPVLIVVIKHRGLMLDNREKWNKTPVGKAKLAHTSETDPVPINLADIDGILTTLKDMRTKQDQKKKAISNPKGGDKESLGKEIADLEREIQEIAPIELYAEALKRTLAERNAMMLHYQIRVNLAGKEIDLYTTEKPTNESRPAGDR